MSPEFDLTLLIPLIMALAVGLGLSHLVGAAGLGLVAAKLGQRHGWLAWIPLLNIVLAWRLAAMHIGVLLLMLIPVINLGILAWMGVRIARRLGRPTVLGALSGLPVLGNFAFLAMGLLSQDVSAQASPDRRPGIIVAKQAVAVFGVALVLPVCFWMASLLTIADDGPSAEDVAEALPVRQSGTLTLFPVDTDPTAPARAGRVVTVEFADERSAQGDGTGQMLEQERLPEWLPPEVVANLAESAVAAEYTPAAGGKSVQVVSLALRPGAEIEPPSGEGRQVQRAEVISPQGEVFSGYRIDEADKHYYVLQDEGLNRALVISGVGDDGAELAARLAQNVGNGQGLLEDPGYRLTFSQVPQAPAGTSGGQTRTFTTGDIQQALSSLRQQGGDSPEAARMKPLLQAAATVAPDSLSITVYTQGEQASYGAGVASYGSTASVWVAVQALRTLGALVPEAQISVSTISIGNEEALLLSSAVAAQEGIEINAVVMQRGATLAVLGSGGIPQQQLLHWAQAYAAANKDDLQMDTTTLDEDVPGGDSMGADATESIAQALDAPSESQAPPQQSAPPRGHRQDLEAKDCVAIVQVSRGDSAISGGGKVIANQCGETVEVFWCAIGPECNNETGNSWTLGAGRSWPISAKSDYQYGACRGRDSGAFKPGTAGAEYWCPGP